MKSLKKKRRIQILIAAGLALVVAVVLIGYGFRDGINLYRSPSQLAETTPDPDEYFQLGGLVKEGSITATEGVAFDFVITDGVAEVPVSYVGRDPAPDLFTEGQGTIAKGYFREGRFQADDLLAKHDETYMPKEVMDTLKETGVYQDPNS
ncbi:cytochrome c maturation protein CcmE [Paracoccus zhejiangensis]|uniref:Cytochrome c-type biogenesis protein CcmE n=1 Tax=Paracoccus zhejiangensis TaxID=1077935 RepID=A0A2H5F3E4_9RHOB|nr:cytochrome c maturation protein CcmE [Paracoccus zhejiangensis]AUH66072.1 cytochrome c biogenesis protein CcmE [Paracoccus zhejiangensis]